MSKKNGIILKDFDINNFIEKFKIIKNEILIKNNIFPNIDETGVKTFIFILKNFGFKMAYYMKYISKINLKFIIKGNLSKTFLRNKISLLFIFFYCKNKSNNINNEKDNAKTETNFKKIYKNIFNIIDNLHFSKVNNNINNNSLLDICDIFQLIQLNLLLGFNDLPNKSYFLNKSIHYLNKIYFSNENDENIQPYLKTIISQIYANLSNSEKNLNFLKREKNSDNFAILEITNFLVSSKLNKNLDGLIIEILNLIYKNNYSSLLSDYILNKIKEGFYELEPNNIKYILRNVQNLYGLMIFLNNLFNDEENEKLDPYMPSSYFVFGGSDQSGIKYNPNNEILRKNFTLIFSFKINQIIGDIIYPLISFVTYGGKYEVIFNLSIQNQKLKYYYQGEQNLKDIVEIYSNTSYLVIIEYSSSGILKDKMKIYVNNQKYDINLKNLNIKAKCSLTIGYLIQLILME